MIRAGMMVALIVLFLISIVSSTTAAGAGPEAFRGSASRADRPKVCIYMFSTPNILPQYAGIAAKINETYARAWGYDFVHEVSTVPDVKYVAWERVRMLTELLPKYSAVFYIDGDACFNDHSKSLDWLLAMPGDVVGSSDHPNGTCAINAGTFLAKNTPWSIDFARKWMSLKWDPRVLEFPFEQKAFNELYKENWNDMKEHVSILPAAAMNSVYTEVISGNAGDTFIVHFMSLDADYRRRELSKIAERLRIA